MIYVASPYSHPSEAVRERRFRSTCAFCAEHAREGLFIYSPIVHWHYIALNWDLPTDWGFWRRQCFEMLEKADELWILCLPGWFDSKGVTAETNYWQKVLNRDNPSLHCPSSD